MIDPIDAESDINQTLPVGDSTEFDIAEESSTRSDGPLVARAPSWWENDDLVIERWHGVFKGGGAKGIAYAGALRAVADNKCWFRSVVGSSAGAITATLIAAGLRPEEIESQTPLLLERVKRNLLGLAFGGMTPIYSMSGVSHHLRTVLVEQHRRFSQEESRVSSEVTFDDLWNATHIELYVVGMDLATSQPIVFNHATTPECDIALAVAASCAIPLAFDAGRLITLDAGLITLDAFRSGGMTVHRIVDGGAWANYPAFVLKDESFRAHAGLPNIATDERIVGFVLDQGDSSLSSVPWAFRPELEADEASDLGLYVSSRWIRAVLSRLDKTRWRLFTFVFWPFAMCALMASTLIRNDFAGWRWVESLLSGWVGRVVLAGTFVISAAILITLALTFYALGSQIIRVGIGTVMAAMSVATDVPDWLGAARGDHVVRVPVPRTLGTTRFRIGETERRVVIETAYRRSDEQLRRIIAGTDYTPKVQLPRSTNLPKPDDVTLREQSHLLASRYAFGNAMLLATFAAFVLMGNVFNRLFAGLPVDWISFLWVTFYWVLPVFGGIWLYRRGEAEREATRRKEQLEILQRRAEEQLAAVGDNKLITFSRIRWRIRRRIFAACLFLGLGTWYAVVSVQDFHGETGPAIVVAREDVAKRTFIYDVIIPEDHLRPGATRRWTFDSHEPLSVGDHVLLRFVGSQGLEVASDGPSELAFVVLILGYLAGVNMLGIRWALTDRAWLLSNPDMQSPEDRQWARRQGKQADEP